MPITMRAARVNAGMTQAAAAQDLGVTKTTLANYEAYKTIPDIKTAKKMAMIYGLTIEDIIFFADDLALSRTT